MSRDWANYRAVHQCYDPRLSAATTKLILFARDAALLAIRGTSPRILMCQGDLELAELAAFEASVDRQSWPLAVLQDSGCAAKQLAHHNFYDLEDGVQATFSQITTYDMGVVQRWLLTAVANGDSIELTAGLVLDDFDELPARIQAHFPGGRDGPPLSLKLPRWDFIDAYERAMRYIHGIADEDE